MVNNLDHVTINIINWEKTKFFYGTLLGLKELPSIEMGDHLLRYFKISDNARLELTEYHYATRYDEHHDSRDKGTIRHIAFEVDDAYSIQKKLEKEGFVFHVPVSFNEKLNFSGGLVLDPNGVEIEFVQYHN